MKSVILILSVLFASLASASMPQYPNHGFPGQSNVDVYYASWCTKNVLNFDQTRTRGQKPFDCSLQGKVCVQQERRISPVQIMIHASCQHANAYTGDVNTWGY